MHTGDGAASGGAQAKKKKSKKKRIKSALGMGKDGVLDGDKQKEEISNAVSGLSKDQIQELLKMNPGLAQELSANSDEADLTGSSMAEQMKRLKVRFAEVESFIWSKWSRIFNSPTK